MRWLKRKFHTSCTTSRKRLSVCASVLLLVISTSRSHCISLFLLSCRYKLVKQRTANNTGQPQSAGQPSQPPTKHKTGGEKPEKGDKQQKRPQTPFHHRSLASDEASIDTEATAGQRLALRSQDGGRFPSIRSADVSAIQKAPQLHSGGVSTGPSEQANSPQPPPLSPHPCERSEESGEGMKNPSTPNSQHFYQPQPEACLVGVKGSSEEQGGPEALNQHFQSHQPNPHPGTSAYSEPPEPTVYVGAAINLEDDSSHAPWRLFNLPRRKEAELPTPLLPGDKLREEAAASQDNLVSVTEWVAITLQSPFSGLCLGKPAIPAFLLCIRCQWAALKHFQQPRKK